MEFQSLNWQKHPCCHNETSLFLIPRSSGYNAIKANASKATLPPPIYCNPAMIGGFTSTAALSTLAEVLTYHISGSSTSVHL